jgi:integrase
MKLDSHEVAQLIRLTELPDGKTDAIYFDEKLPGFGLRLRAGGGHLHGSWVAQYRAQGRTRRMKLGTVNKLSIDKARAAAKQVLARVELGEDPQGDKARSRLTVARTMKSLVDEYLEAKQPHLRPVSYRSTKLYLTGPYFKSLHSTAITEVAQEDVAARLTAIARTNGSVTAARARSALSTFFVWCLEKGLLGRHGFNPVSGTGKPKDAAPRERVLIDVKNPDADLAEAFAELLTVWRAVADDDYGRIIRLLTLTGCRREEIGNLRWSEIDLEKSTLTLPPERVKNGREHIVPLSALALAIIREIPRTDRDFVFGAWGKKGGFNAWDPKKKELDKKIGDRVKEWRPHDIRRTVATGLAELGIAPHIVEGVLNHQSGHKAGVAGVYNRSTYEREKRTALNRWSEHLRSLLDGGEQKIVPMRRVAP